eukprot:s1915_g11.t5
MGRPKKAPPVLPKASMTPVHDILAKARALVDASGKRKVADESTTPRPCVSKAKVSAPAPVTSPQVVKACPPPPVKRVREKSSEPCTAAKSKGIVMKAVPMPTKANGNPPAKEGIVMKAVPMPPKTSETPPGMKAVPTPAKAKSGLPPPPKTSSPSVSEPNESPPTTASTSSSASQRTQEHLAKAKQLRLAKENDGEGAPPKPDDVPDPPMSPVRKLGDFEDNGDGTPDEETGFKKCKTDATWEYDEYGADFACSQREYYGRQGKSWWRDDGWENQWGKNWYWDPYQNRYVWTHGSRSWTTDSFWSEPSEAPQTPVGSPQSVEVHTKLAARQPTQPDLGTPARTEAASDTPGSKPGPGQEQDAAQEVESDDDSGAESWRRDKYGNVLNPNALYMRFYRRLRSKKNPVPAEIAEKVAESEIGKNGKHKLHELYMDWLAAKGDWGPCVLAIRCSKSNVSDHDELYSFLSKTALIDKLGEELAKDLIHRHTEAEKKLPASQKGKFVKSNPDFPTREELFTYKCFIGVEERKRQRFQSSAEVSREAEILEKDMYDLMDKAIGGEGALGAPAAAPLKTPKPVGNKPKKEKTGRQSLEAANNTAHKLQTDLTQLEAQTAAYKEALLKDLQKSSQALASLKDVAMKVLASAVPDPEYESKAAEMKDELQRSKKLADMVKGFVKPKDANAKRRAKKD